MGRKSDSQGHFSSWCTRAVSGSKCKNGVRFSSPQCEASIEQNAFHTATSTDADDGTFLQGVNMEVAWEDDVKRKDAWVTEDNSGGLRSK